jgi:hypothetical protein
MSNHWKYYDKFLDGGKMSRKSKKFIFGTRKERKKSLERGRRYQDAIIALDEKIELFRKSIAESAVTAKQAADSMINLSDSFDKAIASIFNKH